MENENKINLKWGRFSLQLGACIFALVASIVAQRTLLTGDPNSVIIAAALIFLPFLAAAYCLRVPYKTDVFERRLRNWCMTQSAIWVLIATVSGNLIFEAYQPGNQLVSPYVMPAAFLLCHALYSQFLRQRIAVGATNRFTG